MRVHDAKIFSFFSLFLISFLALTKKDELNLDLFIIYSEEWAITVFSLLGIFFILLTLPIFITTRILILPSRFWGIRQNKSKYFFFVRQKELPCLVVLNRKVFSPSIYKDNFLVKIKAKLSFC